MDELENLKIIEETGIAVGRSTGYKYEVSKVDYEGMNVKIKDSTWDVASMYSHYFKVEVGDLIEITGSTFRYYHAKLLPYLGERMTVSRVVEDERVQRIFVRLPTDSEAGTFIPVSSFRLLDCKLGKKVRLI